MVICLERGADLHMAQSMPLLLTVSCFSKIQIGFTFLVPAHLGSPGQRAVKRVCVYNKVVAWRKRPATFLLWRSAAWCAVFLVFSVFTEATGDYYCIRQGSFAEKEIMQGTVPGARRRGRPRTAWMDNIKTWTGVYRGRVSQNDRGQR